MGFEHRLDEMIKNLDEDRFHGADWLSNASLEIMRETSLHSPADDPEELTSALRATAERLVYARPSMAPLVNKLSRFMFEVPSKPASLSDLRRLMAGVASELIAASSEAKKRTVDKAVTFLRNCRSIITCSYSSTVAEVLSLMPEVEVFTPESRPLFEGRRLARELAERGLKATLFVDAAVTLFVGEAEAALVGADSVLADGSIVNKIGTKSLALSARDAGVPFYVVCDTSKFDVMNYLGRHPVLEEKEPSEVVEGLNRVQVKNPYFEVTPSHLVDSVITELGNMETEEIKRKMEAMKPYVASLMSTLHS